MTTARITDLGRGVYQVTHPLPWALDHVHCYAVAGPDGWTLLDAGLAGGDAGPRWREALEALGRPRVRTIVLTHYHPDHIAGSAALAHLTQAEEVLQGAYDSVLARRAFCDPENAGRLAAYLAEQGMPPELVSESVADESAYFAPPAEPTRLLEAGDTVELGGEEFVVLRLPGHADGHIGLYSERTGRLFGGDVLLTGITPNVGRWHDTLPDPLGRYLGTLDRLAELRPSLVYPGHNRVLEDGAGRAREIQGHHAARLDVHCEALRGGAATPWEVAVSVWGGRLGLHERRFALVEAISHLVRLERLGLAVELAAARWQAA